MWVILCATVWLRFSSEQEAGTDFMTYPLTAEKLSCQAPQQASEEQVAFYSGHEFIQMRVGSLGDVISEKAQDDFKDIFDEHTKLYKPDTENKPSEEKTENKDNSEESRAVSSADNKCRYWWTIPKPHVHKLNQKCVKNDHS